MRVIQLLTFTVGNTNFYFTAAGANYTYEGNTYLAGLWDGLSSFEHRTKPAINEHSIKIIDNDLSLTTTLLGGQWQWRDLTVRWLILDDNHTQIDNFIALQGAITMRDTTDDNKRQVTLRIQENHTLELVHGHRTNTASQHMIDSSDDCFEMLPFLDGVKLPWGKEGNGVVDVPNVALERALENLTFHIKSPTLTPAEDET